ncbi:Adenine phosphoribosyltransferase [termite gut metagenome]|uniref:adenine phosphoribosyltransferase n=1 Tax=termite gut metagenome TaxID=433724 RepID=A0A5J4R8W9_9ZZZZ
MRKPSKLPAETTEIIYSTEYGTDTIQIYKDNIEKDNIVLLHDDLLATGGTMKTVYDLVKTLNSKSIYINFNP